MPSLIDLSGVVAIVASSGAVSAIMQWLRDVALDRLTQAMPDAQRNAILRALLIVLNFGAILGLALISGNVMSGALLLSAGLTAFPGAAGSHVLYSYVQKPSTATVASPALSYLTTNISTPSTSIAPAPAPAPADTPFAPDADAPILVQDEPAPAPAQ